MDFKTLDDKIQNSNGYKFYIKHKQLMIFLEGLIIIGLMIGINIYFYQDWQIKKQIRDHCGYTSNNWQCVCTPEAVNAYNGEAINISLNSNDNLNKQNMKNDELVG